jgi:superoxide dismutase, Cu-Zn family
MKKLFVIAVFVFAVTAALAQDKPAPVPNKEAVAVIVPTAGNSAKGIVRFTQDGHGVKVVADIEGLAASAKHGFHIHEFGDCSAPDGTSAGGHFDPAGTKHHGKPEDAEKHSGDLGNLESDANGKAHYEATIHGPSLETGTGLILGRGVIIHAKADDFGQPVGNAGGRIGCGVIGVKKP